MHLFATTVTPPDQIAAGACLSCEAATCPGHQYSCNVCTRIRNTDKAHQQAQPADLGSCPVKNACGCGRVATLLQGSPCKKKRPGQTLVWCQRPCSTDEPSAHQERRQANQQAQHGADGDGGDGGPRVLKAQQRARLARAPAHWLERRHQHRQHARRDWRILIQQLRRRQASGTHRCLIHVRVVHAACIVSSLLPALTFHAQLCTDSVS